MYPKYCWSFPYVILICFLESLDIYNNHWIDLRLDFPVILFVFLMKHKAWSYRFSLYDLPTLLICYLNCPLFLPNTYPAMHFSTHLPGHFLASYLFRQKIRLIYLSYPVRWVFWSHLFVYALEIPSDGTGFPQILCQKEKLLHSFPSSRPLRCLPWNYHLYILPVLEIVLHNPTHIFLYWSCDANHLQNHRCSGSICNF